ncbi:MAG: hypothetical protein H7831_12075, partial [Magnetococcus sp. WYHC-3]
WKGCALPRLLTLNLSLLRIQHTAPGTVVAVSRPFLVLYAPKIGSVGSRQDHLIMNPILR